MLLVVLVLGLGLVLVRHGGVTGGVGAGIGAGSHLLSPHHLESIKSFTMSPSQCYMLLPWSPLESL